MSHKAKNQLMETPKRQCKTLVTNAAADDESLLKYAPALFYNSSNPFGTSPDIQD